MAKPIPLTIPARDPRAELRDRLDRAPEEHAEAILAAYDLLQQLHDHDILAILTGVVSARDEILGTVVKDANTPTAIRVVRNVLFGSRILDAGATQGKPPGLFGLFRQLRNEDTRRGLAVAVGFLESFGRHLKSLDGAEPE